MATAEGYITRSDLREELKTFRDETREEFKTFRDDVREEFKTFRDDVREEFKTFREEMRNTLQFYATKEDLANLKADLRNDLNRMLIAVGTLTILGWGVIIASMQVLG